MHWLDEARLARRTEAEDEALLPFLAGWTGRLALQVGGSGVTLQAAAHYVQWIRVDRPPADSHLQAASEALPFPEASVEAVFLVHTLETTSAPAVILAEAARVLRGEGRLVVVGFHPFSTAALRRIAERRWEGTSRPIGPWRLRRLMGHAGLCWEGVIPLECLPLTRRLPLRVRRLTAGSYAAIGVKRVAGMTVLRPVWEHSARERRTIMPGTGRAG